MDRKQDEDETESNYQLRYIGSLGLNVAKSFSKFTLEAHRCYHQMFSRAASTRDALNLVGRTNELWDNTAQSINWKLSFIRMDI